MDCLTVEEPVLNNLPTSIEQHKKLKFTPSIVVITGAPATGKSTLGQEISASSNFILLDVDQARQKLFGKKEPLSPAQEHAEMVAAYNRNHQLAEEELQKGNPVVLVATYSRELYHNLVKELAQKTNTPLKVISLSADDSAIRDRLAQRQTDNQGFSNITTFEQYLGVKNRLSEIEGVPILRINSSLGLPEIRQQALRYLEDLRAN